MLLYVCWNYTTTVPSIVSLELQQYAIPWCANDDWGSSVQVCTDYTRQRISRSAATCDWIWSLVMIPTFKSPSKPVHQLWSRTDTPFVGL